MAKKKYYVVEASNCENDGITFTKQQDGTIHIHMGYAEIDFTIKECREIIDKLKQCIND